MKKMLPIALVLLLAALIVPTAALAEETHPEKLVVAGTVIEDGQYLIKSDTGALTLAAAEDPAPTSGFVSYNKSTGVLSLNNIDIAASDTTYGLRTDGNDTGSLTIQLVGSNSITVSGTAGGIYVDGSDCTISGDGNLTVTCAAMSALRAKSLTVESTGALSFTASGSDSKAAEIDQNVLLKSGTISFSGNDEGINSAYGSITIEGTANATASATNYNAITCSSGTFSMTGGTVNVSSTDYDAIWAKNASVTGGALNVTSTNSGGLCADENVTVGETADVTITTSGICIYADTGDITVSGGTLDLTSTGSNTFYAETGKVTITGGAVTASAYYPALYGTAGVEIQSGTVTALSSADAGIYSPATVTISGGTVKASADSCAVQGNAGVTISGGDVTAISTSDTAVYVRKSDGKLSITGGTLAAATENTDDYYSIESKGDILINGDAVVYVYDTTEYASWIDIQKGVVYKNVTVTLDSSGNTTLTGGIGTVYGNPNVTGFAAPTDSVLGTVLDEFVTISAQDMPYSGSANMAAPTVSVAKTALTRDLVAGTDYTVTATKGGDYSSVGEKTYTIEAVSDSGNLGDKAFDCKVTEKELAWDITGLTVSKKEDGKTDAAPVQGSLRISGVVTGEDAALAYDSITASAFSDSKAGDYTVTLTILGAKLTGKDAANYRLPTDNTVEAAATIQSLPTPDPTPAPTPAPTPVATPAPTPAPTPAVTPEATPDASPETTPAPTPEVTPEATPAPTPEVTPDGTPTPAPKATPAPTPETTPNVTPEPTPDSSNVPHTGDEGLAVLWLTLLAATGAILAIAGQKKRHKS